MSNRIQQTNLNNNFQFLNNKSEQPVKLTTDNSVTVPSINQQFALNNLNNQGNSIKADLNNKLGDGQLIAFNPKQVFQEQARDAFDRKDWNKLWNVLNTASLAARTGGPFAKYPVAGHMLGHFLSNKGGTINLDYTFALPGQSNWISKSPSTVAKVKELDAAGIAEVKKRIANGETSGTVTIPGSVRTYEKEDGDLYYALGKFKLDGEYKFKVEKDWFGNKSVKIERVYNFSDRYDWDPKLKGGILPHAYPYALQQQGMASEFDVKGRFGEPEYKLPLK